MTSLLLPSTAGYEIPCKATIRGGTQSLLICHGFGSSQDSPTVLALRDFSAQHALNDFSFDWPQHGQSSASATHLRVAQCLCDLAAAEQALQAMAPESEIIFFGSSFGAYLTLLYLAQSGKANRRAFLRSAAVDMHSIVSAWLQHDGLFFTPSALGAAEDLCALDLYYQRPFAITRGFLNDLALYDLRQYYPCSAAPRLTMIHGACDGTAPLRDAQDFAALSSAALQVLPEAEHRLMGEGEVAAVLAALARFLAL